MTLIPVVVMLAAAADGKGSSEARPSRHDLSPR